MSSREDYVEVLRKFYSVWKPLEDLLRQSSLRDERGLNLENRLRASRISDDLSYLGKDPSTVPFFDFEWETLTAAEATGILYVLEGSTMGGAVISRRLREDLAISPSEGGSFFAGHGEHNREMWQEYLAWAEKSLPTEQISSATVSAERVFELLIRCFRQ